MNSLLGLFIIASILGGNVNPPPDPNREAKISKAKADIKAWEVNLIRYRTRCGQSPTQAQGLKALTDPQPKDGRPQIAKPEALLDPWGHPYQYRNPGKHNPNSYDVYSLGPDGIEGTADGLGNW